MKMKMTKMMKMMKKMKKMNDEDDEDDDEDEMEETKTNKDPKVKRAQRGARRGGPVSRVVFLIGEVSGHGLRMHSPGGGGGFAEVENPALRPSIGNGARRNSL